MNTTNYGQERWSPKPKDELFEANKSNSLIRRC